MPREGCLPYDTEGLWAQPVGAETVRVANVPFLQIMTLRRLQDIAYLRWPDLPDSSQRYAAFGSWLVRILAGGWDAG
ncbi:hypothetical protein C6361_06210 [Plantactinospora sp. BC1]|nr:hypothetical protein C6361_06210 [Plantactinospora sp. BC1]